MLPVVQQYVFHSMLFSLFYHSALPADSVYTVFVTALKAGNYYVVLTFEPISPPTLYKSSVSCGCPIYGHTYICKHSFNAVIYR